MSTIDSEDIAYTILTNNGIYPGDPQLDEVYSYIGTMTDRRHFKIIMNRQIQFAEFISSPYVRDIQLLWSRDVDLTQAGKDFINEYEAKHDSAATTD